MVYSYTPELYPTSVRATGVGTAVAIGRIGGVVSPTLGSWALAAGGASQYFMVIAGTMTLALIALAIVKHHVPGRSSGERVPARAMATAH